MLVARGNLSLDARVCEYWPEFAKHGKDVVTVRMLLGHQAGLPALREPIPDDGYCDWDLIVDRLAEQEPFWENSGHALVPGWIDTRAAHGAELPAFGGVGNARALADMYRALAIGGDGLVDAEELAVMGAVTSATAVDATMLVPTRWTTGFVKSVDNQTLRPADRDGVVLSEAAFGHVGMGGSLGFADPVARMSFGYAMNRQGLAVGLDARGQSLVDATYAALGYRRPTRGGSWLR
jgi:CubicO group peptidase (beta-lactamase class C family)